jgi:ribosome maturation factor RimP
MITKEKIEAFVNEKIAETDIFLVDIQVNTGNVIHVYLDKPEGISIEECVEISRFINAEMDRDVEDYELEVSSPGLSFPFKVSGQYEKYLGRQVQIVLQTGKKLHGTLLSHTPQGITIEHEVSVREEGKKRKKLIKENKYLTFEEIKTTKAVVSFK